MKTRAAVAFEAKKPLEIVELDLEGPKAGEVLVEIMATGICHTDAYTLDGFDSEGIFPSVLGHEGAGIVREIGAGVTSVKPGDHVLILGASGAVGSAAVQIALLTHRIEQLTEHLKANAKDHSSRYGLIKMVSARRKLLDYLQRSETERYQSVIERLKLRR